MTNSINYSLQAANQPQYYVVQPQNKKNKLTFTQAGTSMALGATTPLSFMALKVLYGQTLLVLKNYFNEHLDKNTLKEVQTAGEKVLEKTGLKNKGLVIYDADKMNIQDYYKDIWGVKKLKIFPSKSLFKSIIDYWKIKKFDGRFYSVKNGNNAFCTINNKILVNKNSIMAFSIPHEIGHALNFNDKGITRFLQKSKVIPKKYKLFPIIFLTSLFKNKKEEGEKTTGVFDKITTFIKDNCGKLTFITFLPTLAEEGLASVKGLKFAKEFLSPKNFKYMKNFYSIAWSTYFASALSMSLGVAAASKVTDSMKEHFRNKNSKKIA